MNPCVSPTNSLHVIERRKEGEVIVSIFFTPWKPTVTNRSLCVFSDFCVSPSFFFFYKTGSILIFLYTDFFHRLKTWAFGLVNMCRSATIFSWHKISSATCTIPSFNFVHFLPPAVPSTTVGPSSGPRNQVSSKKCFKWHFKSFHALHNSFFWRRQRKWVFALNKCIIALNMTVAVRLLPRPKSRDSFKKMKFSWHHQVIKSRSRWIFMLLVDLLIF